ncbi:polysaccharide pyruvyl transferase family protein [Bifidobacterium adolescentis]|uniref:polysaccharide pyruvyl transferase family protein n=1 Tax=Bifidobacterium adolescentis TaxID=1680 RepID=UPI003BB56A8E
MKKIAILTFTNGMNIGQRLQNYALQTLLRDEGFCSYTVRQRPSWTAFKSLIKEKIKILLKPKRCVKQIKKAVLFHRFNQKYISFEEKKLASSGKCREKFVAKFDGFIVGSDQIWNPNSPFVGENFFLDFVPREKRFTYAPSFSVEKIPGSLVNTYSKRLNRFDYLSVRERAGADIIHSLTGRSASVVLDPTLLLTKKQWDELIVSCPLRSDSPYILSLFLGDIPHADVAELKTKINYPTIEIDTDSPIGPMEFLDLVSHASLVLTDSYHITIFSIIYRKPFINFQRRGTSIDMNSRFKTLYSLLDIPDRSWSFLRKNPSKILDLNYNLIYNALCEKQAFSRKFLHNELLRIADSQAKSC